MRLSRASIGLLAIAAVVLSGVLVLLVFRIQIATEVASRALAARGLESTFVLARLDFDHAVVEGLRIGPPEAAVVEAERIDLRYGPVGLLRGRFGFIEAEGLQLRTGLDGRGARDWPLWFASPGRARAPEISVPDGRVHVSTPAGDLTARLVVSGGPDDGWSALLEAAPMSGGEDGAILELAAARLEAVIGADGAARLEAMLEVAALEAPGGGVSGLSVAASLEGRYVNIERLFGLSADGTVEIALAEGRIELAAHDAPALGSRIAEALLGPAPMQPTESGVRAREQLRAHLEAAGTLLESAAADFSGAARFDAAIADGRIALAPAEPARLSAADGLEVSLAPASEIGGAIVLDPAESSVTLRDLELSARQDDAVSVQLTVLQSTLVGGRAPRADLRAAFELAPWTVDALAIAATAPVLELAAEESGWRARLAGEVRLDAAREGLSLEAGRARFDIDAQSETTDDFGAARASIAVRPHTAAAQHVSARRFAVAGRDLFDLDAEVRPLAEGAALARLYLDGGGLVRSRLGEATVGVDLFARRVTASLPAVEFEAALSDGDLSEARVYAQAPRFSASFASGEAYAQASLLETNITRAAPPIAGHAVRARFEGLSVSGMAAPVRVARAAGEFDAVVEAGRPRSGGGVVTNVEIEDAAEPARFTPLTVSGRSQIGDAVLSARLTGLDRASRTVFTANVAHDFMQAAGLTSISTPDFDFAPGDLQPPDIFPALAGLGANVDGRGGADVQLRWNTGGFSAAGALRLDEVSADTRFGLIEGVSTTFHVADLLNRRTSEPQRVEIGAFDPGIRFEDATLSLSMTRPRRLAIDALEAPFADGVISVAPGGFIDLDARRSSFALRLDSLSMSALRERIAPPVVEVSGRVSGRAPITIDRRGVHVEDAQLAADGAGEVRYAGRAGEGVAGQDAARRAAYEALEDFRFSQAAVRFAGDLDGDIAVDVELVGRPRGASGGPPLTVRLGALAPFRRLDTGQAFRALDLRGHGADAAAAASRPSSPN